MFPTAADPTGVSAKDPKDEESGDPTGVLVTTFFVFLVNTLSYFSIADLNNEATREALQGKFPERR